MKRGLKVANDNRTQKNLVALTAPMKRGLKAIDQLVTRANEIVEVALTAPMKRGLKVL